MPHLSSNQTEKNVISLPRRLPCTRAAVQVVRQDREHGAEDQLKHGRAPPSFDARGFGFSGPPRAAGALPPHPASQRQHRSGETTRDLLDRTRDAAQWRAKVRKVDHRKQQARDPEQMHMGEQRQKPQDGDDLELQFLRLVSHPLGQRVQLQIEVANRQDGDDQEDTHHDHPDIRLAGRRDETRQMVRSQRMKLIAQMFLHVSSQHRSPEPGARLSPANTDRQPRPTFDMNQPALAPVPARRRQH